METIAVLSESTIPTPVVDHVSPPVAVPAPAIPLDDPKARVLTADGGDHNIAADLRDKLAFLSDGRLLVVNGSGFDPHVMAFIDDLNRKGIKFRRSSISLTELRKLYDGAGTAVRTTSERPSRDEDAQNQEMVMDIITRSVSMDASDVHLIGNDDVCRVRVRVYGLLEDYEVQRGQPIEFEETRGKKLRAAIYQGMCDVAQSTWKPLQPQDARMQETIVRRAGLYGARVATRPLDKGQLMVLRLLYSRGPSFSLDTAGFLPAQIALLRKGVRAKQGLYVLGGETGSGKSTTLQAVMGEIHDYSRGGRHILTLEAPPEYPIRGANQTPVIDDDWSGAIKNAMRLDPDVLMIGETRDLDSAQGTFRAALTGHLVWTTVHANGPFAILQRVADLGMHEGMYADASLVRGLIHQYLVPVLCDDCKVPLTKAWPSMGARADAEALARIKHYCGGLDGIYVANPRGCSAEKCRHGHKGRVVVARVVDVNQRLMDCFRSEGTAGANRMWLDEYDGISAVDHLVHHIKAGRVDPLIGESMVDTLDAEDRVRPMEKT